MNYRFSQIILAICLIIVGLKMFAQDGAYTVMTKSGDVEFFDSITNSYKDIKVTQKLNPQDKIKLSDGGYVVLVDTNLQSIELTNEGIYNVFSIDSLFSIKQNSIAENITKFILNEMSTSSEKYNEMKTLGAVVRTPNKKIEIAVPKYGKIIDTLYSFRWHPLPKDTTYIFRVFNEKGNTLYMSELNDTTVTINLKKFNLDYDKNYFWSVYDIEGLMQIKDSVTFNLVTTSQGNQIKREIESLKNDFLKNDSPINNFIIAQYYKSKQLNENAIPYFERTVKLSPSSEFYWAEYINFLLEIGLSQEALIKWNNSPFSRVN